MERGQEDSPEDPGLAATCAGVDAADSHHATPTMRAHSTAIAGHRRKRMRNTPITNPLSDGPGL
jgi:hypothetical protein